MNLSKRKLAIGLCSTVAIVSITLAGLNSSVETKRSSKMIEYANALGTDESTTTTDETTVSTTTTETTTTKSTTSTTSTTSKSTTTTTTKPKTTTTSTTPTETTTKDTVLMVKYENAPVPEAVYTEFTEVEPPVETDIEIVDEPEPTEPEPIETESTETVSETVTETEEVSAEPEIETEPETTTETEPPANICPVTGYELLYSATYNVTSNPLTKSMGVVKNFNGHRETWYSERVLPGYGLKIPGRHCGDDGTVRDENGYICVASDLSYLSRGSIILTTRGPGKVYDTGCAYGTIDIYVNW